MSIPISDPLYSLMVAPDFELGTCPPAVKPIFPPCLGAWLWLYDLVLVNEILVEMIAHNFWEVSLKEPCLSLFTLSFFLLVGMWI